MRRTITDTADRLRPGDHIRNPEGKWMFVADITDATAAGIPGRYAVLLLDPAMAGDYGARLMLINPGHILDINRRPGRSMRPYAAEGTAQVRPCGIGGFEILNMITGDWVYISPGTWRDEFDGAREATQNALNMLHQATPAADPEVQRVVVALRSSVYQRTAEHVLNTTPEVVDRAIELGMVRVVKVQRTTYNRRGERMLAVA